MSAVRSEEFPDYVPRPVNHGTGDSVIAAALAELRCRLRQPGQKMESPQDVKNYLTLKLAELEHEEFHALFLDPQHCVVRFEQMFIGTTTQTSVHPREVVKRALACNATAVIFAHNHPSGSPIPSRADEHLTGELKKALALVDVRVLDHMIVGGTKVVSFAELDLL